MKLVVTLPWEVLVTVNRKSLKRNVSTKRYRDAKANAHLIALDQIRGGRPRFPEQPLAVVMDFYPPDMRRRDVSNLYKLILDALEGVVYADDYQIRDLSSRRHSPDSEGDARVDITITEAA